MDQQESKIPLVFEEVKKELAHVWQGKKDSTLPVYSPVNKKKEGSSPGSVYEKLPTVPQKPSKQKSQWMGKMGMDDADLTSKQSWEISKGHRGTNRSAVKEKIAYDFYYLLACINNKAFDVPKARLAELPINHSYTSPLASSLVQEINSDRPDKQPIEKMIHIMSKIEDGYQDLHQAQVRTPGGVDKPYFEYFKETKILSDEIVVKEKIIPLEGLLELLAAARLLGDIDVLGNSGSNTGFVVQKDLRGIPISAKIVKIDPGCTFTVKPGESWLFATPPVCEFEFDETIKPTTLKDAKDIQVGTKIVAMPTGSMTWVKQSDVPSVIQWTSFTKEQKSRFLKTMRQSINVLKQKDIIKYMIMRNGEFNKYKGPHHLVTTENIVTYSNDLDLLVKTQEKIYGSSFDAEILPDDKQEIDRLNKDILKEKEKSENKNITIAVNQETLKSKENELQQDKKEIARLNQDLLNKQQELTKRERTNSSFGHQTNFFTTAQHAIQNQLIDALQKGKLEEVKKLESNTTFLLPNNNGLYPLAAAVDSLNYELVKYVEKKLIPEEASKQWASVDAIKAIGKIDSQLSKPKEGYGLSYKQWITLILGFSNLVMVETDCLIPDDKDHLVCKKDLNYRIREHMTLSAMIFITLAILESVFKCMDYIGGYQSDQERYKQLKTEIEKKAGNQSNLGMKR